MMSLIRPMFGVASPASRRPSHTASRSSCRTCGSTRFCTWVTRISPKECRSASVATASICSAEASPGMPPIGFSEMVTEP
jgi:hypothetical protein